MNTMDIEHCDRLSWFCEGAKAMSKTARGCRLRPCRRPKQRPAILPWPSSLPLRTGDHSTRLPKSAAVSLPAERRIYPGIRFKTREHAAHKPSTANTQPLDQRLVTRCVDTGEVVEELATLGH